MANPTLQTVRPDYTGRFVVSDFPNQAQLRTNEISRSLGISFVYNDG